MRSAAAKLTFIIITFNVTFINTSHGDIKRRCIIYNQTQAQSECPVALDQSIFKVQLDTASGLSYELGVNGEKKVKGNCDTINKNGDNTFHTGKSGNFNSLREVI